MSTSQKHRTFISEPIADKSVTELPGIGTVLGGRLEKLGYVQRLHASDDRRKVMVQITRKGIDLVEKMREDIVDSLVDLMEDLDGDEKSSVLEAYGKMTAEKA